MAGQPRTRGKKSSPQRKNRPKHRRARLTNELRTARTPADRLMSAVDHLRGALKHCDPDHTTVRRVDEITRQAIDLADELLNHAKNRRKAA